MSSINQNISCSLLYSRRFETAVSVSFETGPNKCNQICWAIIIWGQQNYFWTNDHVICSLKFSDGLCLLFFLLWTYGWNLFVWPMADVGIVRETLLKTVITFAVLFGDTSSAEIRNMSFFMALQHNFCGHCQCE